MKVPPGGGVCCESSVSGVSCWRCTPRMACSTFWEIDGESTRHGRLRRLTRGDWSVVVSDENKRASAMLHFHSHVVSRNDTCFAV